MLDDLITSIQFTLTGLQPTENILIRKHTRKLDKLGDLSFPISIENWKNIIRDNKNNAKTIFELLEQDEKDPSKILLHKFKSIQRCSIIKDNCNIFLNRDVIFHSYLKEIKEMGDQFGSVTIKANKTLSVRIDSPNEEVDLTHLRMVYLKEVVENLLGFVKLSNDNCEIDGLRITTKSNPNDTPSAALSVCGNVLSPEKQKNKCTAEQYLKKRVIDMRLMAEHKYGLRITSQPGWEVIFEKLGEAAARIELLQNKPSSPTIINLNDATTSNVKGASFILYNCARLFQLFKEFDKRVAEKVYPPLPPVDETQFDLLTEPEEWELFFVYILQFPSTIHSCIKDVSSGKINPHNLVIMLSNLCNVFSVYYRRVRILRASREHLYPLLFARIHLLKCLEQVLHTSLRLLNIEPVRQM